jgi:hypothetical protein
MQFREQKIAGSVSRERPATRIGAVQSWRQPDDEQPGVG